LRERGHPVAPGGALGLRFGSTMRESMENRAANGFPFCPFCGRNELGGVLEAGVPGVVVILLLVTHVI
jgi:hypothetical protein